MAAVNHEHDVIAVTPAVPNAQTSISPLVALLAMSRHGAILILTTRYLRSSNCNCHDVLLRTFIGNQSSSSIAVMPWQGF